MGISHAFPPRYEKLREANIARNEVQLEALGLACKPKKRAAPAAPDADDDGEGDDEDDADDGAAPDAASRPPSPRASSG